MGFSLITKRLILEDLTPEDLHGIQCIASDPVVMKYVLIWLESDEQVFEFLKHAVEESQREPRRVYMLSARLPVLEEFVGLSFIEIDPDQKTTAEVGYVLLPAYWNRGYASEILSALLSFGFDQLSLHRVYGKNATNSILPLPVFWKNAGCITKVRSGNMSGSGTTGVRPGITVCWQGNIPLLFIELVYPR